jgi:hypothetical protein
MTRYGVFGALAFAATVAAVMNPPARAFCVGEDSSLVIERDEADDDSFVRSSPASSDSDFRLEVNLDDLSDLTTPSDAPAEATDPEMVSDAPAVVEATSETESTAMDPAVADLDTAAEAEALGEVELEDSAVVSREEYLDEAEARLNQCL